jgi:hypothetical protein
MVIVVELGDDVIGYPVQAVRNAGMVMDTGEFWPR